MKSTWSLIAGAAAVLALLIALSSAGKKAPRVPADVMHGTVTTQEACVVCHAAGKQAPLKPAHPPKEQCLVCHKGKTG